MINADGVVDGWLYRKDISIIDPVKGSDYRRKPVSSTGENAPGIFIADSGSSSDEQCSHPITPSLKDFNTMIRLTSCQKEYQKVATHLVDNNQ
jgi:hypothetical protein